MKIPRRPLVVVGWPLLAGVLAAATLAGEPPPKERPVPKAESGVAPEKTLPLAAMTRRVVFFDARLDPVWSTNQDRLVRWMAAHGFRQVGCQSLAAWMQGRITEGDAYGSVAVLTMGQAPANLAEEPGDKILWVRYLKAGGRIVWLGDLPFNYFQYPDARPLPRALEDRGLAALGLRSGWDQPYWGRGLDVTKTPQANTWGFESVDGSMTGFAVESISVAFGTYVVPETGKLGASSWLKNLRADMPWSGLVKMLQRFDGASDSDLRDVWRAANYVGKPIAIPPLPPPCRPPETPDITVEMTASGIAGRTEFRRGEEVSGVVSVARALAADRVRVELLDGADVLVTGESAIGGAGKEGRLAGKFALATAPYRYGDYQLRIRALSAGKTAGEAVQAIGIRYVPPEGFHWQPWVGTAPNPRRREMIFADIQAAGMEPHLVDLKVEGMDAILRRNMGFSLRLNPDLAGGKQYTWEKNPEFFRLDIQGKPVPCAYAGGRPTLGISRPEILDHARRSMRQGLEPVARHPAFRPYVLCNDDFSIYYGWDFSGHVVKRFQEQTGLAAPAKKTEPPLGAVDENQPWLRWFEFTLKDVCGAMNRAEMQGIREARSDCRLGPIPGGMQIPLIQMWEAQQYPPLGFGRNGFNLVCCYYYNTYWQPVIINTYWMEIGRLGNRGLPEWCMPDLFMTAGYQRNNLFHLLAGGVRGLAYFTYDQRNAETWEEVKRLAPQIRRIGPVQARLEPAAKKDIGLLVSLTTNCFEPAHDLFLTYAYANLLQSHFDVEMTCEEEILSGKLDRYRALLLYNVGWLRRSVYDALVAHIARGGTVLRDNTVCFELPGARRVNIDLGMGRAQAAAAAAKGPRGSAPGIADYGDPERIAAVQQALSPYVRPKFDCPDLRLVANRFEAGGVPYTWFVNAHTGKEYMFCRQRMGAGHPGAGTPEKVAELIAWEKSEMAAGPFSAVVTMDSLPGVPYDLILGRQIAVQTGNGRRSFTVTMDRFGGSLVAFYPEAIDHVSIRSPATARPLEEVTVTVEVHGRRGVIPGAVPVEVTLRDPAGKTSVLSGVRATDGGALLFTWTPAVNDPKGKWTIEATELAGGKTANSRILVGL